MGLTSFRGIARTSHRDDNFARRRRRGLRSHLAHDAIQMRIASCYGMLVRWRLTVKEAAELSRWVT
jgi:hypothetical protein